MARTFPDRSATPKQVREYLMQTLIANHDVPASQARELSLRWEYGRGSDLRDANVSLMDELFGASLGRYLLNSVHDDEYREWRQSTAAVVDRC